MHRQGLEIWDRLFGWRRRREAIATLEHAGEFLQPGTTVLDIGCGHGYVLDGLNNGLGCIGYGCDVVRPAAPVQRFAIFDGSRLPYRDGAFDVAFLVFVLHHAGDPGELLREASRVARRAVVVVEDTPVSGLEAWWGSVHVHSFAKRHGIPWHGRVRSAEEWRQIFQFSGMPVMHSELLGRFERLPPVSRSVFVLQPARAMAQSRTRGAQEATS